MAEVHLIGDIVGGDGFDSGDLFCKWGLSYGSAWRVLEGLEKGQTQVDHPQVRMYVCTYVISAVEGRGRCRGGGFRYPKIKCINQSASLFVCEAVYQSISCM